MVEGRERELVDDLANDLAAEVEQAARSAVAGKAA